MYSYQAYSQNKNYDKVVGLSYPIIGKIPSQLFNDEGGSYWTWKLSGHERVYVTKYDSALLRTSHKVHYTSVKLDDEWLTLRRHIAFKSSDVFYFTKTLHNDKVKRVYFQFLSGYFVKNKGELQFLTEFPILENYSSTIDFHYNEERNKLIVLCSYMLTTNLFRNDLISKPRGSNKLSYIVVDQNQHVMNRTTGLLVNANMDMNYEYTEFNLCENDNLIVVQKKTPIGLKFKNGLITKRERKENETSSYVITKITPDTSIQFETEPSEFIYDLKIAISKDSIYLVGLAEFYLGDEDRFEPDSMEYYVYYNVLTLNNLFDTDQKVKKVLDDFYNVLRGCWLSHTGIVIFSADSENKRRVIVRANGYRYTNRYTNRYTDRYTYDEFVCYKSCAGTITKGHLEYKTVKRHYKSTMAQKHGPVFIETTLISVVCYPNSYIVVNGPDEILKVLPFEKVEHIQKRYRNTKFWGAPTNVSFFVTKTDYNTCIAVSQLETRATYVKYAFKGERVLSVD
ncbi:MAG: hypothetical protein ACI9JN_001779 [Bacteroidia bacterium]|jgi:hypothetical protein